MKRSKSFLAQILCLVLVLSNLSPSFVVGLDNNFSDYNIQSSKQRLISRFNDEEIPSEGNEEASVGTTPSEEANETVTTPDNSEGNERSSEGQEVINTEPENSSNPTETETATETGNTDTENTSNTSETQESEEGTQETEVTPEVNPTEPEPTDTDEAAQEEETEESAPSSESVTVDGITIKVEAEGGAFPDGWILSAGKISRTEQKKVDDAIEKVRAEETNVAESYTFDIKILDGKGNEIQPADGKNVKVSFSHEKVEAEEYGTNIYHMKEEGGALTAEALSVETKGDTATVETDGFSYYTVEFTYGDKQYVLDGGGVIKLDDILKEIGIEGKVKGTTVSAPELFNVVMGKEEGPRYIYTFAPAEGIGYAGTEEDLGKAYAPRIAVNDPEGTIRWVASYQPFTSEEWMDVLMDDGTTYHIVVTDAYMNSGDDQGNVPGVVQGTINDYTSTMPLGDIWINSTLLSDNYTSRNMGMSNFIPGPLMNEPGFTLYDSGSDTGGGHSGYGGPSKPNTAARYWVEYDTTQPGAALDGSIQTSRLSDGATVYQSYNQFNGLIGTCVWPDAAVRLDANGVEEYLDVYIDYSDPLITFEHGGPNSNTTDPTQPVPTIDDRILGLFSGNMISIGQSKTVLPGVSGDERYALKMTVKPYVKDKSGNIVDGNFYYPMKDIDVNRVVSNGQTQNKGWQTFYQANGPGYQNFANYDSSTNAYSESVTFSDGGVYTNSRGESVYIPGAENGAGTKYKSVIDYVDGDYVVHPGTKEGDNNTPYSGFMILAKNGDFSLDFRGSGPSPKSDGSTTGGMESYVLSGQDYNFKLRHSTLTGGNIRTTYEGNHSGKLDDGSPQINPRLIATAAGQTITYTFYPDDGYAIDSVYVTSGPDSTNWGGHDFDDIHNYYTPIKEGDGTNGTYKAWDDDNDGTIDRYTYTFSGINSDNAIHVTWQKTLLVIHKSVYGNDVVEDTFTFRIKGTMPQESGGVTTDVPIDFSAYHSDFISAGDGWYTFTLGGNEAKVIDEHAIPVGATVTVEEVGLGTKGNWECTSQQSQTKVFTQDNQTQQINFNNRRMKVIPENRRIQVKKVWEDDIPALRPSSLTMHIQSGGISFLQSGTNDGRSPLRQTMINLAGNASNVRAFKQGTKAQFDAAVNTEKVSDQGRDTYFWYDNGAIYFYSDADVIYLGRNAKEMFFDFTNLTDISGLQYIKTDYTENFQGMFQNCTSLANLSPLSSWDTTNAVTMEKMFAASSVSNTTGAIMSYTDLTPLTNWNVSGVTTMRWMFQGGKMSSIAPLKNWTTSNLTNIERMFFRTMVTDGAVLADSDSNWDVSHVDNFKEVFRYNKSSGYSPGTVPRFSSRPGSWSSGGTFTPQTPAQSGTVPVQRNQMPSDISGATLTDAESYHEVQQDGSWLYEFEVPEGTGTLEWEVYEDVPAGYYVLHNGTRDEGSSDDPVTGVHAGESPVVLTNRPVTRILTVGKRIDEPLESEEEFEFTIELWSGPDTNKTPYNLSNPPLGLAKTGEGTYKLKLRTNGSSVVEQSIPEIPYGIKYKITETPKTGWRLVVSPNSYGVMNENKTASFLNSKNTNGIVLKIWDDHNNRFNTRPSGKNTINITATIKDFKWKQDASSVATVSPSDPDYQDVEDAYTAATATELTELEKNIVDEVGGDVIPLTAPKYIKLNGDDYVCDKLANGDYNYFKVTEQHTERTAYSTDSDVIFSEDDELNGWFYEFPMTKTERLINAVETGAPLQYYVKSGAVETEEGMVWQVTNTLKTHNLTVEKIVSEPAHDRTTEFNFAIKFWSEVNQDTAHPVKFMHSQFLTTMIDGESVDEYEVLFERGVTLDGKNVKGLHEKTGDSIISVPDSGQDSDKISLTEANAIINALNGFTISDGDKVTGETWSDTTTMYDTGLRLSHLGLAYGGHDYRILVEQPPSVVNAKSTNGRRINYFIVPTGETSFSVHTPYTGLDTVLSQYGNNGTYHFTLRNGQKFRFNNLPAGVHYEVVEYRKNGWILDDEQNEAGVLPDADQTATFTNKIQKGNIRIEKQTEQNETGTFKFRIKLWHNEDFAEVKQILTTGTGTVNDIVEYVLAINSAADYPDWYEYFDAVSDYADNHSITTSKEATNIDRLSGGFTAAIDGHQVAIGTYDSLTQEASVTIPDAFKEQAEAVDGNQQLYVAIDGALAGAICGEHEDGKEHYVRPAETTPVQGEGHEGEYEFTLTNGASKTFTDIPYGYGYDIWEETIDGWELISVDNDGNNNNRADGTMITAGTMSYVFRNDRSKVPLTIGKEVTGNQGSRDKYFKYTITLSNVGERTVHLDMSNATREFAETDKTVAPNSATNASYTRGVIEAANKYDDDADLVFSGATDKQKKACSWTWKDTSTDITYIYHWDETEDVWKITNTSTDETTTLEGTPPADAGRTFAHGQHINVPASGTVTFDIYLQNGETAVLRDLPFGTSYTVAEVNEDYRVTTSVTGPMDTTDPTLNLGDVKTGEVRGSDGMSMTAGTNIALGRGQASVTDTCLQKATEITFTNTRDGAVPTEIRLNKYAWVPVMMAALIGLLLLARKRRVRDEE